MTQKLVTQVLMMISDVGVEPEASQVIQKVRNKEKNTNSAAQVCVHFFRLLYLLNKSTHFLIRLMQIKGKKEKTEGLDTDSETAASHQVQSEYIFFFSSYLQLTVFPLSSPSQQASISIWRALPHRLVVLVLLNGTFWFPVEPFTCYITV